MAVEKRPYAGTWKANKKQVLRYTPDCLVFINGDTSLRSGRFSRKQIDIQPFITQVSCDHGTTPGTASASLSLSIPRHIGSAIFREGNTLLTLGLEVHIYMRGYFSVPGVQKIDSDYHEYDKIAEMLSPDLPVRPYYHCFHGVTTNVSYEYSGGFYSAGLECTGMLHFWQYMDMSTNASLFGPRPVGSNLRMSLVGHNFTGMTPFAIVYSLYKDTAGAAGAVSWSLSTSGNVQNQSRVGNTSLFQQTQRYWEQRFHSHMYRLKMYGVDGTLFSSAQTAMIGRMSTNQIDAALRSRARNVIEEDQVRSGGARDPMRFNNLSDAQISTGFIGTLQRELGGAFVRDATVETDQFQQARRLSENTTIGLAVHKLQRYVTDISTYGAINLFESSYESKLDIAIAAAEACGYEFYQDVDGDLVFKPPLYNMATKSSPTFCVKPRDVISISYAENEPEATFMTIKSEAFSNTNGMGLSGEWGVQGKFIDYKLVAKFGWRPGDADMSYFSDGRQAFWGAVARLAIVNKSMHTATLTIPLRPELRCGYPIYIEHIDTYYYISSMSHSFQFGGACQTTLQLCARRAKFCPPGILTGDNGKVNYGADCLDFANPVHEPISIRAVHTNGNKVTKIEEMGFPNVVMALDTEHLNPLTWALGIDATDINSPSHLNTLLRYLWAESIITPNQNATGFQARDPQTWTTATWNDSKETMYQGTMQQVAQTFDIGVLFQQVTAYAEARSGVQKELFTERKKSNRASAKLQKKIRELEDKLVADSFDMTIQQYDAQPQLRTSIFTLIAQAMLHSGGSANSENMSSASILNILGDRKAMFNNASTPGYYRYFSSSHPDVNHHAPTQIEIQPTNASSNAPTPKPVAGGVQDVADDSFKNRVRFAKTLDGVDLSEYTVDEEQANELKKGMLHVIPSGGANDPVRGFEIARGKYDAQNVILPSHLIQRLEFCMVPLKANNLRRTSRDYPDFTPDGGTKSFISGKIMSHMNNANPNSTLAELLPDFLNVLNSVVVPQFPVPSGKTAPTELVQAFFNQPLLAPMQAPYRRYYRDIPEQNNRPTSAVEIPQIPLTGANLDRLDSRLAKTRPRVTITTVDGVNYADEPFERIPLDLMPLFCNLFVSKPELRKKHYGAGWKQGFGRRADTPYDRVKAAGKLHFIKKTLADTIGDAISARLWKIAGQIKEMWTDLYGDPGGGGAADETELQAWQLLIDYARDVGSATASPYNVTERPIFTGAAGMRLGRGGSTLAPTAVFPVSDNDGYEHYGSYAYGRGVDIAPGGTYEQLHNQDPLMFLGDKSGRAQEDLLKEVDAFAQSLIKSGGSISQRAKDLQKLAETIQAQSSGASMQAFLDHPVINVDWEQFQKLTTDKYTLRVGGDNIQVSSRTAVIMTGLMNLFSAPGRPQQIQNTGYSLADLNPLTSHPGQWVDSTSTLSDAFVKFDAYDASNFIYVPSGEGHSPIEDFVKNQMLAIAIDWGITQETYRGKFEIPYETPKLDKSIFDPYSNMFGEGAGEFWEAQFSELYDKESGEGLFVDIDNAAWNVFTGEVQEEFGEQAEDFLASEGVTISTGSDDSNS